MFHDRHEAGQRLAQKLISYHGDSNTIVLGLARGGVVVAHEIGKALQLPVDVLCPRKVGAPFNPELAVGAVAEDGSIFLNVDICRHLGLSEEALAPAIQHARQEALRQATLYRKNRSPLELAGKTVMIVDDGLATGATMRAAIAHVKKAKAKHILVAVPVSPPDTWETIQSLADEAFVLLLPSDFAAVGAYYFDFSPTSDAEVLVSLS